MLMLMLFKRVPPNRLILGESDSYVAPLKQAFGPAVRETQNGSS